MLYIFLLLGLFYSCSSDNINGSDFLGGEIFTESNVRVVLIDTMSVQTSTMKYDSIISSAASRILIGKYTDTIFGDVETASYFEIVPTSFAIDSDATYDSIAIYLKYDGYYYNDTISSNTIHIKKLNERLKPDSGEYFYNTSQVGYFEEDLGLLTYSPRPNSTDSLEIKISDDLGTDLFEKFQESDITTTDGFKDYFKGLSLRADDNDNGAVVGYTTETSGSYVRLYFSVAESDESVQSYIDFTIDTISSPTPFFNSITAVAQSGDLQKLTDKEIDLPSTETGNKSYIQSGIGIATRIQFPHVKSLYDIPGDGTISDAVLKVRPSLGSYDESLYLKDVLEVYVVDRNNDIVEQLATYGTLNRDNEEFNNIYYEIPLGSYLEKLLLAETDTQEALILLPSDYASSVDRCVLNGNQSNGYETILELTYVIYDNDN